MLFLSCLGDLLQWWWWCGINSVNKCDLQSMAPSQRTPPPFHHLFLSWDWGSDKEEQGTQWLGSELLLHHLVVSGIEQVKTLGLWEQKCSGGAYLSEPLGRYPRTTAVCLSLRLCGHKGCFPESQMLDELRWRGDSKCPCRKRLMSVWAQAPS